MFFETVSSDSLRGFFSRKCAGPIIFAAVVVGLLFFVGGLLPRGGSVTQLFGITRGEGFLEIAGRLKSEGLIRSKWAFEAWAVVTGGALHLKSGTHLLSPGMSVPSLLMTLTSGLRQEIAVRIPEGATLFDIDAALAKSGVLGPGVLIAYASSSLASIEGTLFPDTYHFFLGSAPADVLEKFSKNFEAHAAPILARSPGRERVTLILASLLEREVPDGDDRRIVAGILQKRIAAGIPLQVDATVCYVKELRAGSSVPCSPLTALDLRYESPYNTYLRKGLPPGPIGNPGTSALDSAREPQSSPYWFYLSDPKTKKTIFARTLDEHTRNRVKYLSQ